MQKGILEKGFKVEGKQHALMENTQKDSEENEKTKANALAQSKYDGILTFSADLEDSLN